MGTYDMNPLYMASLNTMLLNTAPNNMGAPATAPYSMGPQSMATQIIAEQTPVAGNVATEADVFLQAFEQEAAELTRGDRQSSHANDRGKRKSIDGSNSGGRTRGRGPY